MATNNNDADTKRLKKLGSLMMHWHASGGDPIYAVGSYFATGKRHPNPNMEKAALIGVEAHQADEHAPLDKLELAQIRDVLRSIIYPSGDVELNISDETIIRHVQEVGPSVYFLIGSRGTRHDVVMTFGTPVGDILSIVNAGPGGSCGVSMQLPKFWRNGLNEDYLFEKLGRDSGGSRGLMAGDIGGIVDLLAYAADRFAE